MAQPAGRVGGQSLGGSYPLCKTFGMRHPRICVKATGLCFHCGQLGHKVVDYPVKHSTRSQAVQSVVGGSGTTSTRAK